MAQSRSDKTAGPIRWGICSAGRISNDFAVSLKTLTDGDHKVVAVGARSLESAQEFAKTHSIPRAYGSYEEVAADDDVDAVYIGTVNTTHFTTSMMVLDKGKPVLCEKPLTMNLRDTQTLVKKAQEKGLFMMEGIWMRFFPAMCELRKLINEGTIGEVKYVKASFAFRRPTERLVDPSIGGGSLNVVGVYALNFASMVFGGEKPQSTHAWGQLSEKGTDELVVITLCYSRGRIAQLACGVSSNMLNDAVVCGTKGHLRLHDPFLCPTRLETSDDVREFPLPSPPLPIVFLNGTGMRYEAEEVRRCLQEKRRESLIMPHKETVLVAEIMEEIMKQIGVVYFSDNL